MNVRLVLRGMARNRGFATLIIGTMALGIGANTTMFSLIRAVFLRPLPFPQQERVVTLWESDPAAGVGERLVSPANFVDWAAQSRSFEALGALNGDADTLYKIVSTQGIDRVRGVYASSDFFRALGVTPELGRFFGSEEDHTRGLRHVVISHAFWQQRFHGDPKVIGQTLNIDTYNGGLFTVAGVIPKGLEFPVDASIWLSYGDSGIQPLPKPDAPVRCCSWLSIFARLKPGITIPQAEAELTVIARSVSERHPDASKVAAVKIVPLREQMVRNQRTIFFALAGAVAFVLLIACANVANLLLSRGISRAKEMQTRHALGASAWQIAQQLLAESLVLCLFGTAAGLLLALWAQDGLVRAFVNRIPIIATARIDGGVLAFAALTTILCAAIVGLAPLLQRRSPSCDRGQTESTGSKRLRHLLAVGELALSLVLITGAGLLGRTVLKLSEVSFGVRTEHILAVSTDFNIEGLRERETKVKLLDELVPHLESFPGVAMAAATTALPMDPVNHDTITPEGRPYRTKTDSPQIVQAVVTPDYFQLMGIPLQRGRGFNARDTPDSTLVAILSEAAAQRYWPGEDPVGKRFAPGSSDRFGWFRSPPDLYGPEWREVVGIVGDVRSGGFNSEVLPVVYYSHRQASVNQPTILVRSTGDPLSLAAAVRNEFKTLKNPAVITNVRSMEQVVSDTISEPRTRASLVGLFAGLALLLGMLGIYGVASHGVTQRTQEIGIRMALGARGPEVARMVMGGALRLSSVGAALGLLASMAMARSLASLLFGIQPLDPVTLLGSCGCLMAAAIFASYVPARRAMRIDPAIALRNE